MNTSQQTGNTEGRPLADLSEDDRQKILKAYQDGVSPRQLVQQYNLKNSAVVHGIRAQAQRRSTRPEGAPARGPSANPYAELKRLERQRMTYESKLEEIDHRRMKVKKELLSELQEGEVEEES